MKNIVLVDEYHEHELKPNDLLNRYLQLAEAEVQAMASSEEDLRSVSCPGCGAPEGKFRFEKFGFRYQECPCCHSLYLSSRPTEKQVAQFYKQGKARKFWREELSWSTRDKRQDKIIRPRFQWVLDSIREYAPQAQSWVDVNTTQYGYVQELAASPFPARKILLDPFLAPEDLAHSKIEALTHPWWDTKFSTDVVSLFEVVDRTSDVPLLMEKIYAMLNPGGLCFVTTTLSSGFDIQVLGAASDKLYPPDRMNVLSVQGFQSLAQRYGWECLEFSTPGILDVEVVVQAVKRNPQLEIADFARSIVQSSDDVRDAFQKFLQQALLSSYGRILFRKKA